MAFLALNDVTMICLVFSVMSTFLAIGSIAIGLHHVWRHRDKQDLNANQAVSDGCRRLREITNIPSRVYTLGTPHSERTFYLSLFLLACPSSCCHGRL